MNWTALLKSSSEDAYRATLGLVDMLDDGLLEWKPATGSNWMTTGQLLMHLSIACGACCRGFLTGDWGLPPEADMENMSPEEMLPPAEKLPSVESVAAAREAILHDRDLTSEMISEAGEELLASRKLEAPWAPGVEKLLGHHFLEMVGHLNQHKCQLFYYLKLMGKPVDTHTLYGIPQ